MTIEEKEHCNKVIAAWMEKCWHEVRIPNNLTAGKMCKKCGFVHFIFSGESWHPDYFPPSPQFWELVEEIKKDSRLNDVSNCPVAEAKALPKVLVKVLKRMMDSGQMREKFFRKEAVIVPGKGDFPNDTSNVWGYKEGLTPLGRLLKEGK